jgi:hypothetical protein
MLTIIIGLVRSCTKRNSSTAAEETLLPFPQVRVVDPRAIRGTVFELHLRLRPQLPVPRQYAMKVA